MLDLTQTFYNAIKNPKSSLGAIALLLFAAAMILGDISDGSNLMSARWVEILKLIGLVGGSYGLFNTRDADKTSEQQKIK